MQWPLQKLELLNSYKVNFPHVCAEINMQNMYVMKFKAIEK